MCDFLQYSLRFKKKRLSLHCVFHSIRFKVNKRLGLGGAPFFMPINFTLV